MSIDTNRTVRTLLTTTSTDASAGLYQAKELHRAFQVVISAAATVTMDVSLDKTNYTTIRTTTATECYSTAEPWPYMKWTVASNTGTVTILVAT